LGENGTGKSTLMHILSGYFSPSSGSIFVDGKERRFSASADALAVGIGMVRQHPGFVRGFQVWEDCILGAETQKTKPFLNMLFDPGKSKKRLEELNKRWGFHLPLDNKAESLTVSQRQKAAILALLLRDVKWLIFDEPTAVLTSGETKTLIEVLNRLRDEGRGIVLITHKLDEALAVSDRITVIRQGITQEPRNTCEITLNDLKTAIFGGLGTRDWEEESRDNTSNNNLRSPIPDAFGDCVPRSLSPPILIIRNLTLKPPGLPSIENINLQLMPGKILGITGVRDGGLETLEHAVVGIQRYSGTFDGVITLNGHDITAKGVRAFRDAGGAYLGADRLGNNLAPGLPLKESLIIHIYRKGRRKFFLDMAYLNLWCRNIMKKAGIARSVSDKATSFSGGMLQRVLLAREFAENASLVVLAEPGSGLDKAKRSVFEDELRALAGAGTAVLLFSTDMEELTSVADEIMELKGGVLAAVADRGESET
jgi:simple sugar transport system ATP-binding protein